MPSKNERKIYLENGVYHVYNRGLNKEHIFLEQKDYTTFTYLLSHYLMPTQSPIISYTKNYYSEITVLAFCLMPNHIHFLIKQKTERAMPKFMQSLLISYNTRFNRKYERVGPLFQARYKARLIENKIDLLNTSKYIHQNPREITTDLERYKYCSLTCYIGHRSNYKFVVTDDVMAELDYNKSLYREYVMRPQLTTDQV